MKFVKHPILISLAVMVLFVLAVGCCDTKGEYVAYEKEPFENGITIEYTLSEYAKDKGMYVDTTRKLEIDPEKSALVIIDLWQEKFLDSMTVKYINPLIEEFKDLGVKIIYAPSQNPQNTNLTAVKEGFYFYNLEMMDNFLRDYEIKNVFFTGFDTFHCVLDKPNGIYSLQSRNDDLRLFLLEDGVTSFTKEMKQASMSLLKKNGVGIVSSNKTIPEYAYDKKTDTDATLKTKKEIREGNNFILLFKGDVKNKALEHFEHELNMERIAHGVVKNNRMFYRGEEVSQYSFVKILRDHNIRNLYFSGFHLNNEMLWSDFGITPLYIKIRYYGVEGLPWPYIINDLSFIAPSESMEPELEKATIINHYRMAHNIMSTTVLDGIKKAKTAAQPEAVAPKK